MCNYGDAPKNLGLVNVDPKECMFWLYLPVKLAGNCEYTLPDQVRQYEPLLRAVRDDLGSSFEEKYIYITAKNLFLPDEGGANREGWHSDGFLSDDLNYIWYDCMATEFWEPVKRVGFSKDHEVSMREMELLASAGPFKEYPSKNLLRLDESVIHRVSENQIKGFRSFVKVSVSDDVYALEGNSINHELETDWKYIKRKLIRNDPKTGS